MISSYFFSWECHMTPVRGGQNTSMRTTWREERAATKQRERVRERERGQHEPQSRTKRSKRAAVGNISASRTRTRTRRFTTASSTVRTTDQEQLSPPCQSPSEEKTPAGSCCRTSSGETRQFVNS